MVHLPPELFSKILGEQRILTEIKEWHTDDTDVTRSARIIDL
jgi:hypothetical protein